jgi:hypothetical protein
MVRRRRPTGETRSPSETKAFHVEKFAEGESARSGFSRFIAHWKAQKSLIGRLSRINPLVASSSEDAVAIQVKSLVRGRELMKSSRAWTDPLIGEGRSARNRGRQWKLVMAYGGFELLIKSINGSGKNGLGEPELARLLRLITLREFEPITSPAMKKRRSREDVVEQLTHDEVLDFIRTDKGDRAQIRAWMLEKRPCATWVDAALLAKALRNCTAHGALSPTKVGEWVSLRLSSAFL